MRRWSSRIFLMMMVVVLPVVVSSRGVGQSTTPPGRVAPPVAKPPATPEPAAEASDDPWEERKARAREDIELLEAMKKAKLAEVREAEIRVANNNAWRIDHERQKKGGILTPFQIRQADLIMAEGQAQLEMKRVDLKNVEIRLARSRRRLKAVERSPSVESEESQAEERFRELEIKYDRLKSEFDRIKRYSDFSRDGQTDPLRSPLSPR